MYIVHVHVHVHCTRACIYSMLVLPDCLLRWLWHPHKRVIGSVVRVGAEITSQNQSKVVLNCTG